jgi:hypothetical protein
MGSFSWPLTCYAQETGRHDGQQRSGWGIPCGGPLPESYFTDERWAEVVYGCTEILSESVSWKAAHGLCRGKAGGRPSRIIYKISSARLDLEHVPNVVIPMLTFGSPDLCCI